MFNDARFALRMFARRPGVAALIVFTLAIGIAASITVFTLADAILWHPVPFRDPERLVHLRAYAAPSQPNQILVPVAAIDAWSARGQVVSAVYPWAMTSAVIGTDDDAEQVTVGGLSAGLISELGSRMPRGREFDADDVGRRVAIVSDEVWRSRFHASADAVGQSIRIDGQAHTIIGVMPRGFEFPVSRIKIWMPYAAPGPPARIRAVARLRQGVTFDQAASFVESTTRGFREQRQLPELRIVALVNVSTATASAIYIMLGGVLCILLIAVANAGNILLGEIVQRRAELAVRRSLGASPLVLARQLLIETTLRSSLAAIVALLLARWAMTAIVDGIPFLMSYQTLRPIAFDWRAVVFGLGVSFIAGCGAAVAPFAHSTGLDVQSALKRGAAQSTPRVRMRDGLTVIQLASTLVLLVAAGLLVNGFVRLMRVDMGFRSEGLIVADVALPRWRFSDRATTESSLQRLKMESLQLSGVSAATVADGIPPHMSFMAAGSLETGDHVAIAEPDAEVSFGSIDDSFFATLGIPIVAGRSFTAADVPGRMAVAIVSRALAKHLWPNADAIGQQFRSDMDDRWLTVVGIAGDVVTGGFDSARGTQVFYTPQSQAIRLGVRQVLVVRAASDSSRVMRNLPALVRRLLPGAPVNAVETASDVIAQEHSRVRFATFLMSGLAAVAVALAMLGVYGAFWCAVRQRTREIGVRLALGAAPRDILAMVLTSSGRLVLVALAFGVPLALAAARGLRALLYEVSPADPATLTAVSAGLVIAALAATYLPARRASRVDPSEALRYE